MQHLLNLAVIYLTKRLAPNNLFDLNTQQIIYSKNAFGVTGNPENNTKDVTFSKSSDELIIGCLKKILKDLNAKSIV